MGEMFRQLEKKEIKNELLLGKYLNVSFKKASAKLKLNFFLISLFYLIFLISPFIINYYYDYFHFKTRPVDQVILTYGVITLVGLLIILIIYNLFKLFTGYKVKHVRTLAINECVYMPIIGYFVILNDAKTFYYYLGLIVFMILIASINVRFFKYTDSEKEELQFNQELLKDKQYFKVRKIDHTKIHRKYLPFVILLMFIIYIYYVFVEVFVRSLIENNFAVLLHMNSYIISYYARYKKNYPYYVIEVNLLNEELNKNPNRKVSSLYEDHKERLVKFF